jgi:hypothetical protein
MKLPTEIDDSFTHNPMKGWWVQAGTGLTVTDGVIRMAKIKITNQDYVKRYGDNTKPPTGGALHVAAMLSDIKDALSRKGDFEDETPEQSDQ